MNDSEQPLAIAGSPKTSPYWVEVFPGRSKDDLKIRVVISNDPKRWPDMDAAEKDIRLVANHAKKRAFKNYRDRFHDIAMGADTVAFEFPRLCSRGLRDPQKIAEQALHSMDAMSSPLPRIKPIKIPASTRVAWPPLYVSDKVLHRIIDARTALLKTAIELRNAEFTGEDYSKQSTAYEAARGALTATYREVLPDPEQADSQSVNDVNAVSYLLAQTVERLSLKRFQDAVLPRHDGSREF
jgi:hypothetical protein